jgi:hypothetical protein
LKVSHVDLAPVVLDHARSVDLNIAGQSDPDWEQSPLMDFPERLVLESGRPTLVIPYVGRYRETSRNVVIAWKAGRESARAVFDALPILAGAETVDILEIKERRDDGDSLAPDTTIAASLAPWHQSHSAHFGRGRRRHRRRAPLAYRGYRGGPPRYGCLRALAHA